MAEAPERIYLQVGPDCEAVTDEQMNSGEVTWASDRVFDTDIEYVRADIQAARIAELEAGSKIAMEKCEQYFNASGITDAEVHAVLQFIHRRLAEAARKVTNDE